jgi:AcrR family transcriptional regulator
LTIEAIADESGLSNGAVYYNFANKEDLFLALLEDWRTQLIDDVESAFRRFDDSDGSEEQLRDTVRSLMRTLSPRREWRLLLLEFVTYAARNPKFRARFVAGRQNFKAALTRALEQRTAALGTEPSVPPERLALLLTALVNGLSVDLLTEPGSVPDDLLEEAVSALLRPR